MTFTHSAIGKNTEENRKWLEGLGYTPIETTFDMEFTRADHINKCYYTIPKGSLAFENVDIVICTHSDELFRAVTAMREGTDTNIHFTCYEVDLKAHAKSEAEFGSQPIAKIGDIYHYIGRARFNTDSYLYGKWREASLQELINHFK